MNILYLSHLSNNIFAGPNFSVPAGIKAQQEYDNCFWVNLTHAYQEHWGKVECYHSVEEFGKGGFSLERLPKPFQKPDLVVFEGFYNDGLYDPKLAKMFKRKAIPYIIVPRGSLTQQAMDNHGRIKKRIAHLFYFDSYCRNALTIQFLTEQEYKDSFKQWNKSHIIIPNGFDEPEKKKGSFSKQGIKMIFIGRPDKYHKGIDVLWEALIALRNELRQAQITLDFYAPKGKYDYDWLAEQVETCQLKDIITMHDKIGGEEKEKALLETDLFVMTSRFEGHPMGLIEALAYGIPVLVTPGTNMAQEIQQYNAGWVTDCDANSIAATLQKIVTERLLLVEKGRKAQLLAANYQWDKIAKDFHNQVKKLLTQ